MKLEVGQVLNFWKLIDNSEGYRVMKKIDGENKHYWVNDNDIKYLESSSFKINKITAKSIFIERVSK